MKSLATIILFLLAINAHAKCTSKSLVIQALISEATSEKAYNIQDIAHPFLGEDRVKVYEVATQKTVALTQGTFLDNGAGDYTLTAESGLGESVELTHDHETSEQEGLIGQYINSKGEVIDLKDVKCSSDLLIKII